MVRRSRDSSQRTIYALYDKDEQLVFTGDINELMQYTGCLYSTIQSAISREKKLIVKHPIIKKGNLYALYDKDERLVLTGTIDQIVYHTGCNKTTVYNVINEGRKLSIKYKIEKAGYEPITEKRCYRCGKVLPVEKMVHYHRRSDGKYVPRTICKVCKANETYERNRNKKKGDNVQKNLRSL